MPRLGVNIDHIATIREARKTNEPDPVYAAFIVELAGAHGVTIHLREDRRHIHDRDLRILKKVVSKIKLNLEMAVTDEMLVIAEEILPDQVTLVPEKREEVTTEGGLDIIKNETVIGDAITRLRKAHIETSLFIDPDQNTIRKTSEINAHAFELHTGSYALATSPEARKKELDKLQKCATLGTELGLVVHAGHGLTYQNVQPVARIPEMTELNIGHSIISRAVFTGLDQAIREMLALISDI